MADQTEPQSGAVQDIPPRFFALGIINQVAATLRRFGLYGLIGFCFWQAGEAIEVLAGKTTIFDFIVGLLMDTPAGVSVAISVTLPSIGVIWALRERRLRRRTVERLHARIKELELMLDPKRSSSGILEDGRTRPEDRE